MADAARSIAPAPELLEGLLQQASFTSKMMVDSYDVSGTLATPTVPTFQASLSLFDGSGAPLASASTVAVWASEPVTLTVGGQPLSVGDDPQNPTKVAVSLGGQILMTCPAGIGAPNLFLQPDFFPSGFYLTAFPDTDNLNRLAAVQASDLDPASALGYDGQPILLQNFQDADSRTSIASAIRNTIGRQPQTSGTAGRAALGGLAADAVTRPFQPNDTPDWQLAFSNGTVSFSSPTDQEAAHAFAGAPGLSGSVFSDLGHFVDKVVRGAEKITSVVWKFAEGVANVLITAGEDTFNFSVHTIDDAVQVVAGIVKQVVTDVSHFLEWLSYLFEWDKFVATHKLIENQVKSAIGSLQTWIGKQIAADNKDINAFFTAREQDVEKLFGGIIKGLTGQTLGGIQQSAGNPNSAFQVNGQDVSRQSHWLLDKVHANAGSTAAALAMPTAANVDFIALIRDFFASVGQNISNDPKLATFASDLQNALQKFSQIFTSGAGFLGQALADVLTILEDLAQLMMQLANDVVDAFLTLLQKILDSVLAYLTAPLTNIPFVSDFYRLIAGDALSPLSLFALIVAVPTTIVYEFLTGSTPGASSSPSDLLGGASINWLGLANTFVMLLLIPLWIAGDLSDLPAPLSLAIAAATLTSIGLSFAVLNSQETHDFIMLCAQVAAVSISVYGIGVASEDQAAWKAVAPLVYGGYGFGMIVMYGVFAALFPVKYFDPNSETMFANICSALPYLGQPLNYIKADDVGPAAVSLVDFFGYGVAAALNTISNWSS